MNRTMVIIAVVLGLLTVLLVADIEDRADGTTYYVVIDGLEYWSVPDANIRTYNDSTLVCENVYVKEGSIRDCAFKNCTRLERVYCSVLVTSIGDSAFEGCTGLQKIHMERVKTIGEAAFLNSSVSSVTVGSSLTKIGDYAFAYCKNLSNPILANSGVKTLGDSVFYNSGILADDIRGLTSMEGTSFKDAEIRCLAMRTDQALFNDTSVRLYDDDSLFTTMEYISDGGSERIRLLVKAYTVLDPCDKDGAAIPAAYSSRTVGSSVVTYSTIGLEEGRDIFLRIGSVTIRFQEALGIPDASVQTGLSEYVLPEAPSLGELSFTGWTVPGIEGTVSSIPMETIAQLWPVIEPVASYSYSSVSFDHSQLGEAMASSLPHSMEFTLGSAYPVLNNVGNMGFACWIVNGDVFEGGDEITCYSKHTAKSVWAEDGMFTLTVHDCSAGIYSEMEVVCTSPVKLEDIVFEEPDGRMLVGWSLADGGDRIRSETIRITGDTDIFPLTKNRTRYTISYMDGFNKIGEQSFYEGKVSAIDVDIPDKHGMKFVRWMCKGIEYHNGDLIELDGDMTFYSEWVTLPSFTVTYDVEPKVEFTRYEGTEITIGTPTDPPEHKTLSGWSETGVGGTLYADKETFVVDRDISFSPVWADCDTYVVRFHHFDGELSCTEVYSDDRLTLEAPDGRIGLTFCGWSLTADSPAELFPGDSIGPQADVDLFETWSENGTFTVTVHDGATGPHRAYIGDTITVTLEAMTRDGFIMRGWSENEGSPSPEYAPSCTAEFCMETDLYPVWERLMVLTYHVGTETRSECHEKGSSVILDAPVQEGLVFDGWSTEPDGDIIAETSVTISEDMDLYANWTEEEGDDAAPVSEPEPDTNQKRGGIGLVEGASAAMVAIIGALMAYQLRRN